ncbi:MAG: 16S rRNA (cytosine(967)-C(5))-methyltransferase RsmB [Candidatus Omnitrophota bacterium]
MPKKPPSPARCAALFVLDKVLTEERILLEVLPALEEQCRDARDLALAREIVSGTCRWLGRIRHVLRYAAKNFDGLPDAVKRILELSVYQLFFLDRAPAYAVLSDAVELTRRRRLPALASAVNAILRRLQREVDVIPYPKREENLAVHLAAHHSHPQWLVERWLDLWGEEETEAFCRFNNERAPLSLRLRGNETAALEKLRSLEIVFERDERFPNRIQIAPDQHLKPDALQCEEWAVQDGAAMLVPMLLAPKAGWKIWDVCAAPGGKTFFLADMMGNQGEIAASDRSELRLDLLRDQQKRFSLSCIKPLLLDVLRGDPPAGFGDFDAILLDAPCTGWGAFRRHPDLRWRLRPEEEKHSAEQAQRMLGKVHPYLKPGGVLVYSTCTLSPEENEKTVERFLNRHPSYEIEPAAPFLPEALCETTAVEGWMRLVPQRWNLDGAFAARLRKKE